MEYNACGMIGRTVFSLSLFRVVSVSACLRTHPSSIALRYVQRRILMSDPNWNNGRYYGNTFPRVGMQHARYIGMTFGRGFLNTARLRALLIHAQVFTVCYLLQGGGHHRLSKWARVGKPVWPQESPSQPTSRLLSGLFDRNLP